MRRHAPKISLGLILLILWIGLRVYNSWEYEHHHVRSHRENPGREEAIDHPRSVDPKLEIDGLPKVAHTTGKYYILPNQGYVSGYDAGIEDPLWVETEFFDPGDAQSQARPGSFSPDDRIEAEERIDTQEYSRTGYDRGHMAPNEGVSLCYGRAAQVESFLLTNVVPQRPNLNRGIWETLEKIILNDYAKRFGKVWIIDGPVFDQKPPDWLHEGRIAIPTRCYKIIIRQDNDGNLQALAFEIPQDLPGQQHDQRLLLQYLTSIDQIEHDTGLVFLPQLDQATAQELKSQTASRLW